MKSLWLGLAIAFSGGAAPVEAATTGCNCKARAQDFHFRFEGVIKRQTPGYTEGLEFHNGRLYESTGMAKGSNKPSQINQIDVATGAVTNLATIAPSPKPPPYFGEGLSILNGQIYQMTETHHKVFRYDLNDQGPRPIVKRQSTVLSNDREGWGMTNDGSSLISSDGSNELCYRDPKTFATRDTLRVCMIDPNSPNQNPTPVRGLNELEYVKNKTTGKSEIFANIGADRHVVRIDPETGCVTASFDLNELANFLPDPYKSDIKGKFNGEFGANGIAYDAETGRFFITGKNWPVIIQATAHDGKGPQATTLPPVFGKPDTAAMLDPHGR